MNQYFQYYELNIDFNKLQNKYKKERENHRKDKELYEDMEVNFKNFLKLVEQSDKLYEKKIISRNCVIITLLIIIILLLIL